MFEPLNVWNIIVYVRDIIKYDLRSVIWKTNTSKFVEAIFPHFTLNIHYWLPLYMYMNICIIVCQELLNALKLSSWLMTKITKCFLIFFSTVGAFSRKVSPN